MAALVTFIVLLWLAFLVMRTLPMWASSKGSALRNTVALLLAAGSSYAVGFVLHLWVEATAGEIPIANVVAPSVMWLFLAAACMVSAIRTVTVPLVLSMPIALNALLALVATGVQSRHIFVALPLAVIAALPFAAGQLLPSPASAAPLTTGMVTSLGGFHLDQPVSAAPDLKEFSAAVNMPHSGRPVGNRSV
jgi:hypothetical protein